MHARTGILALLSCLLIGASTARPIDLPGDRLYPESLSIAPDGTAYLGSLHGGVLRVSLRSGRAEQWIKPGAFGSGGLFGVFVDTRNRLLWTCTNDFTARGVTVAGSDPGSLAKAFDLRTGEGRFSFVLPGAKPTCNDFAVAKDGTVYVTDTATSHILFWRSPAKALALWLDDPLLAAKAGTGGGLDGIAIGGEGSIYVNNVRSGDLFRIGIAGGKPAKVTRLMTSRPLENPDGMRSLGGNRLLLAESHGRVALVTVDGDRADVRTLAEPEIGPTGVDAYRGSAWYVQGQLGAAFSEGKQPPSLPFRLTPVAMR